jgi:ribonucleotide reductase beta subunit family protein with ferritin-like domain
MRRGSQERTAALDGLAQQSRPFAALYEHWERHHWSPFAVDFSVDAATFAGLDETTRKGLVWVFAHRFQAEFNVAALLAPFLLAAPDYDVQLLLATQVADEHRHIESVLRVYAEVFGVEGGIAAVKALSDAQLDPAAAALYAALDGVVRELEHTRDEDSFLRAVLAYHVIAEGSIGRANQTFVGEQFKRVGAFPGLEEVQRLAVRDEVRHIGIGVSYARRRLARDGERAAALIRETVDAFHAFGDALLEDVGGAMSAQFVGAYGAEPAVMWGEVRRQLGLRLHSMGFATNGDWQPAGAATMARRASSPRTPKGCEESVDGLDPQLWVAGRDAWPSRD